MSSPTLTDEQLEKEYGRRPTGATCLDEPQELGYICPKGHGGDCLAWSEFQDHIWCVTCQKDYHYATDCSIMRMCWMSDKQWQEFLASLPLKAKILEGIQHFPDCETPHEKPKEGRNDQLIEAIAKGLYTEYCRGKTWTEDVWEKEPEEVQEQYRKEARQILQTGGYNLRPDLQWFAEEMEKVLRENDHKHGINTEKCYRRLIDEALELNIALSQVNTLKPKLTPEPYRNKAIKEAVDVANFAMFIARDMRGKNGNP